MAALLLCGICSAERKIFPAKGVDFAQFKTYEIMTPRMATKTGIHDNDERFAPLARRLVEEAMAARGFQKVASGGDLQVLTAAIGEKSPQLEAIFVYFNYQTDWGYPSGYGTMSRVNREGTLILGFIDRKTQKGLWVGTYTSGLGRPGTEEKTIEKAMGKLFEKFPPKK
jgi:hypothetical protein